MKIRTIATAGVVAGMVAGLAPAAMAQFPERRISIIVPYAAGGATDILARQVAEKLGPVLGQTVTVDNRPGAGATLGTTQAANARPDGYTLFLGQVSSHGIAPAVYENLQYDPVADFQPITFIMSIPNVMVVNADSPYTTVEEFIAGARESTKTFASSGTGSSIHLSGEMFQSMTDLEMTHVPFRGSGEAVPALISGDVDVMFDNLPSAISHIRSGALRPLAVTTTERSDMLPEVPTVAELGIEGLDGFSATSWFAIFAPSGVSDEVVETLSGAMQQILEDEDLVRQITERGGIIEGGTPEDLAAHVEAELAAWAEVVRAAGVTVD
ncbi:MAG: Bug family tripartite tricarboxylate transporter substrate binding protein [Alkalilacustris sp.]